MSELGDAMERFTARISFTSTKMLLENTSRRAMMLSARTALRPRKKSAERLFNSRKDGFNVSSHLHARGGSIVIANVGFKNALSCVVFRESA